MMSLRSAAWILGGLSAGLALACTGPLAGGSEVTNGKTVAGILLHPDGTPSVGARIWIRRAEYVRDTSRTDPGMPPADATTDARGGFVLDSLPQGTYRLEARDGEGLAWGRPVEVISERTVLPPDTLRPAGSLEGRLQLLSAPGFRGFVQIQGLERVAEADSAGFFAFTDLPAGRHSLLALSSLPDQGYRRPGPLLIQAGDTTRLGTLDLSRFGEEDYGTWPFSRLLRLDPAGAGLSASAETALTDFPLLVRLDSGNFDFALSRGGDLRFSGPGGKRLAYEVERWDPEARRAEVWVRLDTVALGSPYLLTMHWGRLDSPDFSSGPSVFASFAGVWHMGDPLGAGANGSFADASPSAARATGPQAEGDREGAIGDAGVFQGAHFLEAEGHARLRPAHSLTLSAWIMATGSDVNGGEILSMGNNYGIRVHAGGALELFVFDDTAWTGTYAPIEKWKRIRLSGAALIDQRWHQVAGVVDDDSLRIYLDGNPRGAIPFPETLAYVLGKDFRIGAHGNGEDRFDFRGRIDEVRISEPARSPAWIRLAYANQAPGSTLLEFR